jgi:hypothetical protein
VDSRRLATLLLAPCLRRAIPTGGSARQLGRASRSKPPDKLLFWLGIGAAQKGAGSKTLELRHWVVSLIAGVLIALLIAVGSFFLLVSQQ